MNIELTRDDRAMLDGDRGLAAAFAMRVVTRIGAAMGARRLLDVTGAHIDSCLYHGPASVDFAQRLVDEGARVSVPATLNVSSLDLRHPELVKADTETKVEARRLTRLYEQMGCRPTWTCAPYQSSDRPGFGEHVVWAESNAIVFANSALGARTNRYGDFIDIAAAIVGRAPAAGFHLDEHRLGQVIVDVGGLNPRLVDHDMLAPVLGYVVGEIAGSQVPVINGLPPGQPEHRLKALFAAAASSGGVGMVHVVGSTPEAPDLRTAVGGEPVPVVEVGSSQLWAARRELGAGRDEPLGGVCLGTPHYSVAEFEQLVSLLNGRSIAPGVGFWVNTSREVELELGLRGWADTLRGAGVTLVTDTCTYITPIIGDVQGVVLTDSAKWAHYAPGNVGADAAIGSVEDCVESAVKGRIVSVSADLWGTP